MNERSEKVCEGEDDSTKGKKKIVSYKKEGKSVRTRKWQSMVL